MTPFPTATVLGAHTRRSPFTHGLHVSPDGRDFIDDNGARYSLAGIDGFLDYRLWLDGREAALDPFVKESTELGFDVRRVLMQGSKSQNQVLELIPANEPEWRAQLRPFGTYMNANRLLPLLTVCVDNQVIHSDLAWMFNTINEELRGLLYLVSWGNELDKNGGDPNDCPTPPDGVFWSRGSATQDKFYPPDGATASEFHPVRDYNRCLMDAVASAIYMRDHGCNMLWLDEGIPADDNSDPRRFWEFARVYATLWSVGILHNRDSQRGRLMTPNIRRCAEAWVRGMRVD